MVCCSSICCSAFFTYPNRSPRCQHLPVFSFVAPPVRPFDCPIRLRRLRRVARRPLLATASDGASLPDTEKLSSDGPSVDAYLGLFVRMLGLDNDPLDREQGITTLCSYSQGGRKCIDAIMNFPGCINLAISLLKSDSLSSCKAAAALLRNVTAVKLHRDIVAENGAIEEILNLLCRPTTPVEVREQCLYVLWNFSIDENFRFKIAKLELLLKLVRFLDDDEIKVKEASGGIIANLALSSPVHGVLVEAGVIPKLADLVKVTEDGYKVIRKEAKTALLEFCKDEFYRINVIEEGLIRVPLVGSAAYKAFKPLTHSWPSLPDGSEIPRDSRPSRYGASELLLGLSVREKNIDLEESKKNAVVGRSQQQFLARIGAIELEEQDDQSGVKQNEPYTLLPCVDGIARLVLILGLQDDMAIIKAARAIADASINEHIRISFKVAGAVRYLIKLLHHSNETIKEAVACAMDKLTISYIVCQTSVAEGVLEPCAVILKQSDTSTLMFKKTVNILSRILNAERSTRMPDAKHADGSMDNSQGTVNGSPTLSSHEEIARLIDYEIILKLVSFLNEAPPLEKMEVASVLEHLTNYESQATAMVAAGIGSVIESILEEGAIIGREDGPEQTIAEIEEVSLATSSISRTLARLLDFDLFYRSISLRNFGLLLRKILKSAIPLHTKDWVAACLVKIELKVGLSAPHGINTIEMEVNIFDTIPRLVEKIRTAFSYEEKAAATVELNRIISNGIFEYTKAVATSGGIFPLVDVIKEAKGDGLEAALAILYNLSTDPENHPAMLTAGIVPALKRIVLAEAPQGLCALRLLRALPS